MPFSDPSYSNNIIEGIKPCAGKGCRKTGTNSLEVMFINKIGWFCDSCKSTLLTDNLVVQGEEEIAPQQKMKSGDRRLKPKKISFNRNQYWLEDRQDHRASRRLRHIGS